MKYYIIAGEASGDMHGANLIKSLKDNDPQCEVRFWGGDKMSAAAGTEPVMHYKESSIMGFLEVLKSLRKILGFLKLCRDDIAAYRPDAIVFIDYPGFNLKIAKWAHGEGYKTFYYISPKVWAWKEGRVKLLKRYVDKMLVIFPFEVDYFQKHGVDVKYVGNPLLDEISDRHAVEKPERAVVALVAGSRRMEIDSNLAPMVAVARNFPDLDFVVTGVDWLPAELYEKYTAGSSVKVVFGRTYETLARSSAALVTSGTATLEAALLGVPEVVCYRAPAVSLWIARRLVHVKWISLVNLIMDRTVVREMIGNSDFSVENATEELRAILPGGAKHDTMMRDFEELRAKMGDRGASDRAAKEIIDSFGK